MDKLLMETPDITKKNIEKIGELFPNVITEALDKNGKLKKAVDFEKLKQELSDDITEENEKYDFTWVGKREAKLEAARPIRKTLRPDKESSVNWDDTENIYIEGDNLDALKLLQESYLGKIKMIYIDPPYNTGSDFIYKDNFTQDKERYEEGIGYRDEDENRLFKNTDSNGKFHSDWCSMIYPRLKLARNLLSDDGVIFISIDDNEVRNLKNICDEIFGEGNFISVIPRVTKKSGKDHSDNIAKNHDFLLIYVNNIRATNFQGIGVDKDDYGNEDEYVEERGKYKLNQTLDYNSLWYNPAMDFPIIIDNLTFYAGGDVERYINRHKGVHSPKDWVWRWSLAKFKFGYENGFVVVKKGKDRPRIYTKTYLNASIERDNAGNYYVKTKNRETTISSLQYIQNEYSNDNAKKELNKIINANYFDFPKPVTLIKDLIKFLSDIDFIILDFFSGSSTTAHACMQLNAEDGGNRKFIMVQLPEPCNENSEAYKAGYKNICEIGKERIRRAGKKISEENPDKKLDIGFRVFKVDSTNMKDVYYTPRELNKGLLQISNIKENRSDEDLLYGCLLDWGVELSLPHKVEIMENKRVHIINEHEGFSPDLIACFEDDIPENVIKKIALKKPTRVVFKDSSFITDDNKINVEEIFKLITPDTKVKVI